MEGNTYSGNGGVVRIEFKSGGKAYVAAGPISTPCTYTEGGGGSVTLVCEGDKTVFKVDGDALNGPQEGFLGHLTKQK